MASPAVGLAATTNLVGEGRFIIPNKAALLAISSDLDEPAVVCANFASVVKKCTYNAGVPGHYFHLGKGAIITSGEPLLAKFKEFEAVILATKLSNAGVAYLYGVPVEKLRDFVQSPPAAKDLVEEAKMLTSWRLPDENLESLSALADTETDKLRAYADKLISHLGMFKVLGIRSVSQLKIWVQKGYEPAILRVVLEMEKAERKQATANGVRAADAIESVVGGAQAGARWALVKEALLGAKIFYGEPLADRIIEVPIDSTTGKPTAEMMAELTAELQCACIRTHHTCLRMRCAHVCACSNIFLIYILVRCC